MTYYSAFCEKPTPRSFHRSKRDRAAVCQALLDPAVTGQRLDQFTTTTDAKIKTAEVFA